MMLRKVYSIAFLFFFTLVAVHAQQPINTWKDYLNYSRTIDADMLGDRIYVASQNGIFIYNQNDNSMDRLNRINGLSDIGINLLRTYPEKNLVFIGYINGNIDLIQGSTITNYPEVKNSSVVGDKSIRHVSFFENTAFISTGVGIFEFDLDRVEIRDTYTITAEADVSINETTILNDSLFAATDEGLFAGSLTQDLTIFSNWNQDLSIPAPFSVVRNCATYANTIYINIPQDDPDEDPLGLYKRAENGQWENYSALGNIDYVYAARGKLTYTNSSYAELVNTSGTAAEISIFNYNGTENLRSEAIISGEDGNVWLADYLGLVKRYANNSFEFIAPEGPATNLAFDLDFMDKTLVVASGSPQRPGTWSNNFVFEGFYRMKNQTWKNFTREDYPEISSDLFIDICKVSIDPLNSDRLFVGSYFSGMYDVLGDDITTWYTDQNSSMGEFTDYERSDNLPWLGITGFVRDNDDGLWITNSNSNEPLLYWSKEEEWSSYDLDGVLGNTKSLIDIILDDNDQKWMIINKVGIAVFDISDDGNTTSKKLNANSGSGGLPSNEVLSMTKDLDGEIWVGTIDGIAVFYSPFDVLTDNASDARRILVEQDGVFQYLLEGQSVSAIAIDGANRKWIGTFGAGVFLMSEDGTEQIQRFTVDNSPLFSNSINDIVIDQKTGEVFIATQEGILSYISDATVGRSENECISVFPNPVRETYEGPISITGLKRDSEVRITDIRGNLINKMVSNGGNAIWDGKNTDGVRVATGVYFALSTDTEGESGCVTKILMIK